MKDKDRIKQLEQQLEFSKRHTHTAGADYIHEIHTLYCSDGELYLGYGEQEQCIVINVDTLYKDLPSIISMVIKENKKQQKMYADMIKETLTEL